MGCPAGYWNRTARYQKRWYLFDNCIQ